MVLDVIHIMLDAINSPIPLPLNKPVVTLSKFVLLLHFHFWVNPSIITEFEQKMIVLMQD